MLADAVIFIIELMVCRNNATGLERKLHDVNGQIRKVVAETANLPKVSNQFPGQLKFIEDMARQPRQRSYRQIIYDLSLHDFPGLQAKLLTVEYTLNEAKV